MWLLILSRLAELQLVPPGHMDMQGHVYSLLLTHCRLSPGPAPTVSLMFYRDDTPHVPNEKLGEAAVLAIVERLTNLVKEVFPGRAPCLIASVP